MDGLMVWVSKPSDGRFMGLGLKTRAEVPRRDGRHVAASGSSRQSEATGEKARWSSDQDYTGLDNNTLGLSGSTHLYPRQNWECVIALLNRMREPPSSSPPPVFHFLL